MKIITTLNAAEKKIVTQEMENSMSATEIREQKDVLIIRIEKRISDLTVEYANGLLEMCINDCIDDYTMKKDFEEQAELEAYTLNDVEDLIR